MKLGFNFYLLYYNIVLLWFFFLIIIWHTKNTIIMNGLVAQVLFLCTIHKTNIIDYSKKTLLNTNFPRIKYYIILPVCINYNFILWRKWKSFKLPPHVLSLTDNSLRLLFLICFKRLHNCISPYYHNYYFKFIYI